MDTDNPSATDVIARLGGISAVARICEITPPSVHRWKTIGIPLPWRKYLRLAHPEAFQSAETTTEAS